MTSWHLLASAGVCSLLLGPGGGTVGCVERVSARLSEDARNGWDRAVVTTGSSFTALIEAIGLALHERSMELPAEVVEQANRI